MNEPKKLNAGQKHMLRLIAREQACPEGWAKVSKPIYPLVQALPSELVELLPNGIDGQGRVRLTPAGQNLLDALEWL